MKALLWQSACMRLCIGSQSAPCHLLLILSPTSTNSLGLHYTLCAYGRFLPPPLTLKKKDYCLLFCSRIEMKMFLSHCMKQEEQGDDSRSPKPPTHSQEVTDLLQDQQGMWELHSSQTPKNVSWAQAVSCGYCLCICNPAPSGI